MRVKGWMLCIAGLSLVVVLRGAPAQMPMITGGIRNLHINGFCRDSVERLWIATSKGLCCYDGSDYAYYYHQSDDSASLGDDNVNAVLCDGTEGVWVAHGQGVALLRAAEGYFQSYSYADRKRCHFASLVRFGGDVYACGLKGIARADRGGGLLTPCYESDFFVRTISPVPTGNWWIGGGLDEGVIVCLDGEFREKRRFSLGRSKRVNCSNLHPDGRVWFGTEAGIVVAESGQGGLCRSFFGALEPELARLRVTTIQFLGDGRTLIGSDNRGLFVLDAACRTLVPCGDTPFFEDEIPGSVTCCLAEENGNIWVGTFDRGLFRGTAAERTFNRDRCLHELMAGKFVSSVCETPDGTLWLGTLYDGLFRYDPRTGRSGRYTAGNSPIFAGANRDFVQCVYTDSRGKLWIGSEVSLAEAEYRAGRLHLLRSFPIRAVTLCEDEIGRIWAGTARNGAYIITPGDSAPVNLLVNPAAESNNITRIIRGDAGEMLLSAFSMGVFRVDEKTLHPYPLVCGGMPARLETSVVTMNYDRERRRLWLGAYGSGLGLFDRERGVVHFYGRSEGLPSNDILGIERSDDLIWISTSYGISRFDPDRNVFLNFFDDDGTGGNQFHEKSSFRDRDGNICFGGNHGLTRFDPAAIVPSSGQVPVVLTDLKIGNRTVRPGDTDGILERVLQLTERIVLNHRQRVFSVDYGGVDLISPQTLRYAYKLEGFDADWNYVEHHRRAVYSNLRPGSYRLSVKACNRDGTWENAGQASLWIDVKGSPWLSLWALAGYAAAVLTVAFFVLGLVFRNRMNAARLRLAEAEKRREQELSQLKVRFFGNMSHELRTPLTLICGGIGLLKGRGKDPAEAARLTDLVDYNIRRLLRLLDQMVDLTKIVGDALPLGVQYDDAAALVRDITAGFACSAHEKGLEIRLEGADDPLRVPADFDKLDKIVYNLLSNAVKYTPRQSGSICVRIERVTDPGRHFNLPSYEGGYLRITVSDLGEGMSDEELGQLFLRYQRFRKDLHNKNTQSGLGIGLNYARTLAGIHKGEIAAWRNEPRGMVFSVAVPADPAAYDETEWTDVSDRMIHGHTRESMVPAGPEVVCRPDARHILVVEDNNEVRSFLVELLEPYYFVSEACDGIEGYEAACREIPDLILSDVLMPRMDGYELCRKVRKNDLLCHIPFVMLTARTQPEERIEGYEQGADVYLEKPFYPELLLSVVKNSFENMARRQAALTRRSDSVESGDGREKLRASDRRFLEKIYDYLDRELSNPDLNVNALGQELGFSRTSFYRKIKGLTGVTPNDFLRIYRLNRSTELIRNREHSLTEVADMTGFGTYSHFSASFKKHFGVSPRDYLRTEGQSIA